jgi:hypothetical protein
MQVSALLLTALACVVGASGVMGAEGMGDSLDLSVRAADGRTLNGVMDARSDERLLWVRRVDQGVVLTTAVAWRDVAAATLDGDAIESWELRERRAELASPGPRPGAVGGSAVGAGAPAVEHAAVERLAQVRNLEIVDACVVNLDRDVEPDGIAISIAAVSDHGEPLAVAGSLTVALLGERRPARVTVVEFGELDRWTQPVAPGDFIDGVAMYQLPFRRSAPEWQFDLLPDAVLTAQLGAFGHGNYAASTPVVIRPFNPLRDNLQLLEETRFLPGEWRGRKTRNTLAPENGLWLHWTR